MQFNIVNEQVRARVIGIVSSLPLEPVQTVVINEKKDDKTLPQLRTVHGWFRFISTEYAESRGEFYPQSHWKEYLKDLFGVVEVVEIMGKTITRKKSLAKYKKHEMSKFMDDINHFCGSELMIFVPVPGVGE